jgi:hypothetical protein
MSLTKTSRSEVAQFIRSDAAATPDDALRLCIGHVPLVSMMGRTSESYRDELGKLLVATGYSAFFAGHEHLVWEQELTFPDGNLHHIHVGTGSGTYHFPLSRSTYDKHCAGNEGTLPYSGRRFALDPGTRQQADKVNICMVQVSDGTYSVEPLTLRNGELVTVRARLARCRSTVLLCRLDGHLAVIGRAGTSGLGWGQPFAVWGVGGKAGRELVDV